MQRSAEEWHNRFIQQAGWTGPTRRYLLRKARLGWRSRILEVGCGTGAVTARLNAETHSRVYGLDIDRDFLRFAAQNSAKTRLCAADGLSLPFASGAFDATACHFFLLWIAQVEQALAEMVRVTRPCGAVLAFAEPDYGGRIDFPDELAAAGRLQAESLRRQGAEPARGRQLAGLFHAAGLSDVETGVIGGQWHKKTNPAEVAAEWAVMQDDLEDTLSQQELQHLEQRNAKAWDQGERVLFVPTFFALGRKS